MPLEPVGHVAPSRPGARDGVEGVVGVAATQQVARRRVGAHLLQPRPQVGGSIRRVRDAPSVELLDGEHAGVQRGKACDDLSAVGPLHREDEVAAVQDRVVETAAAVRAEIEAALAGDVASGAGGGQAGLSKPGGGDDERERSRCPTENGFGER